MVLLSPRTSPYLTSLHFTSKQDNFKGQNATYITVTVISSSNRTISRTRYRTADMSVSFHELACLISRHSAHDRRQSGLIFNRQGKDWDKATNACKHSGNGQFNDMLKSRQLNNSNRHTTQGVSGGVCHTPEKGFLGVITSI